jgi:rhodanese-related sulfurtransferase
MSDTSQNNSIPEIEAFELFKRQREQSDTFVLDVREPNEYREGHIPNSKLIPLGSLGQALAKLPKDRPIYVSCRSGKRSATATAQLIAAGFDAVNMRGGLLEWSRLQLPLEHSEC